MNYEGSNPLLTGVWLLMTDERMRSDYWLGLALFAPLSALTLTAE